MCTIAEKSKQRCLLEKFRNQQEKNMARSKVYVTDRHELRARRCLFVKGLCACHGTSIYHPTTAEFQSQRLQPRLAAISEDAGSN